MEWEIRTYGVGMKPDMWQIEVALPVSSKWAYTLIFYLKTMVKIRESLKLTNRFPNGQAFNPDL